ncbi:hypothetical protein P7H46_09015 [Enterococcus pseudoavium]|uniref:Uncharacterized protein n=1 Tax=Enterococcus pseudoavium TaxID=44007 RepID=A0ABU3FIT5_9ENTE|nr:hypothetical protein [Enterococcus pseudoavium]MDT2770977.1 hypothetical protein [Enterococcus pseudoavium]
MRVRDRVLINQKVRKFVKTMPVGYERTVPKDVVISEILQANEWFIRTPATMETIREEVEKQFDMYVC